MKKSDLLHNLEKKFDYLPKREVERTLEKILQFFSSSLAKGSRIEIRGFGSFSTRKRKAKIGRNPSTGEKINIREKSLIHFIPGKKLRKIVDEKKN